jgi:hypothetical protein
MAGIATGCRFLFLEIGLKKNTHRKGRKGREGKARTRNILLLVPFIDQPSTAVKVGGTVDEQLRRFSSEFAFPRFCFSFASIASFAVNAY